MKFTFAILAVFLISSSLGSPSENSLIRQRRDVNFIGNTKALVEELIQNLRSAAQQAFDAITTFTTGMRDQRKQFTEKIASDIQKFRERIQSVIKSTFDRFTNAGSAVRNCIDGHFKQIDNVFNDTVAKSKQCAGDRIAEIGTMIENLQELSSNATNYASAALTELQECTETNLGILSTGTCLSGIAIRTELKGAVYLTQSGLLISRINLAFSTLPASLEICAGTKLVEAGINSAKIIMEAGTCSASSVYSSLNGNISSSSYKLQNNFNHVEFLYTRIQKHARNPRDLSYIWNKIKSDIAKAWEALKKIADKTKQRQCLDSFQDEILNDLDVATWIVSHKALTVRNTIDDGLETIMNCVTEGLSKAMTTLVGKFLQIILCVKSNKQ
ncbi:uncharacterized protein LOC123655141 [Melitaea cinxia]|uniref:uncharacterized protein LOC123655141 n=1 Tax=Melitaea cinxia TaxID=113334 RepID=UPI001E26F2FA|nr:uncharacterized protein LOC123655141 [Melitaea cinxia]